MDAAQSKRWVIVSLGIASAAASLDDFVEGRQLPQLRTALGAVIAGIGLTLLAEAAPDLAAGLALTILVGALLRRRGIIDRLSTLID